MGDGSAALGEVIEQPLGTETVDESTSTTAIEGTEQTTEKAAQQQEQEKTDGRKQPDALRKRIAELKRQAETVSDPVAKKAILDDARALNDKIGKVGAYESLYPTVREVREVKALFDSVGGREGFLKVQEQLANVEQIDAMLAKGDPAVLDHLWEQAKAGMPKLVPAIMDRIAKESPEAYSKLIVPHAVRFFDQSGFPEAFDQMTELVRADKKDEALALAGRLVQWFVSQRQGAVTATSAQPDPEREKFERERTEWEEKRHAEQVNASYGAVVEHAGPVIDKFLKPLVAKLGLSTEQYALLREDVWSDLQKTRNADPTYKTVAGAKYKQGMDAATEYIKSETEARAKGSAEKMAKLRYGHQLKAGAVTVANPTAQPGSTAGVTRGTEPSPNEIDYSPKGRQIAAKAGFPSIGDMILAGQAPMKSGGIRKWR